jgi:hypothetical protein
VTEQPLQFFEVPPLVLPRPKWESHRTKNPPEEMIAWVHERLRVRFAEETNKELNKLFEEMCKRGIHRVEFDPETLLATLVEPNEEDLIDLANQATEADQAPIEPLREELRKRGGFYAKLAELIKPNRGQWERRHTPDFRSDRAAEDVRYIRDELWPQEYDGRRNRKQDNPPSAEVIAAKFWNVEVGGVISRLKKLKRVADSPRTPTI